MGSRAQFIQLTFRFATAACMLFYVPIVLILLWLALTLFVNFRLTQLENAFNVLINVQPKILKEPMLRLVRNYKKTWLTNGFVWGIAPFLVVTWLPRMNQIYCAVILLVLSMMSITRTHSDRKLMNHISTILVGSQILALIVNLALIKPQPEDYYFCTVSVAGLFFILGLLQFSGNLLNILVRQYLNTVS